MAGGTSRLAKDQYDGVISALTSPATQNVNIVGQDGPVNVEDQETRANTLSIDTVLKNGMSIQTPLLMNVRSGKELANAMGFSNLGTFSESSFSVGEVAIVALEAPADRNVYFQMRNLHVYDNVSGSIEVLAEMYYNPIYSSGGTSFLTTTNMNFVNGVPATSIVVSNPTVSDYGTCISRQRYDGGIEKRDGVMFKLAAGDKIMLYIKNIGSATGTINFEFDYVEEPTGV